MIRRASVIVRPLAIAIAVCTLPPSPARASDDGGQSVDQLIEKKMPGADDWTTEHMHDRAKKQLKMLAHQLVGAGHGDPLDLTHLLSPRCTVSALRPRDAVTAIDFGATSVLRAAQPEEAERARASNVEEQLRAILEPFGSAHDQEFEFKALAVDDHGNGETFGTTMYVQCFGHTAGGLIQQNAVWDITWNMKADRQHPLIDNIASTRWTQATVTGGQRYVDRSGDVLDSVNAWHDYLPYGADFWHNRMDTLGGVTFLGHQGLAVGDASGDGLDDLYVAQATGFPNLLLIQNPDGTVTDHAADAGVDFLDDTKGVLILDIDNDGDRDIICAIGPTILILANDGQLRFRTQAVLRAPDESAFYMLTAADYDEDGDLDIYATRYVPGRYGVSIPVPWHDANNGPTNHLFRNDGTPGSPKFVDVTVNVGLDAYNRRFSVAASWADYDNDGDLDLYVANDFGRNNLYHNRDGHFVDAASVTGTEDQAAGMGVSWGDFDLDGNIDLHVGNMFSSAGRRIAYQRRFKADQPRDVQLEFQRHALGNSLYHNVGDGTFHDVSARAGIRMGRWSWGARFVDMDNNGYPDIISPNGFITNESKDDL